VFLLEPNWKAFAESTRRAAGCVDFAKMARLSSPVTGNGIGGRNSAFVLECVARRFAERTIACSAPGNRRNDGKRPGRGGRVEDGETLPGRTAGGLDPGTRSGGASVHFFSALDDLQCYWAMGGGNNLRDLRILLAEP